MTELFEKAAVGVEAAGVLLLLIGVTLSTARYLDRWLRKAERAGAYRAFRRELGRTLLLTLEFLVAADIIYTVAIERTFESLGMLGLLVLVRTFLSFALELEVTGRWPWQGGPEAATSD